MITDAKLNLPIHAKQLGIWLRRPGPLGRVTGGFADTAGGNLTLIEQAKTRTALEVARKA
jgi:hypothetical protein